MLYWGSITVFALIATPVAARSDPAKVFRVHDGMVHVSGSEYGYIITKEYGYIITKQEYGNYHLRAEFKWGDATYEPRKDKARDTGILIHVTGEDKVWPTSIEYHQGPWKDGAGTRSPENEVEKPHREWNLVEVICQGDRVTFKANGKVANEGERVRPSKGRILFQSEGAEVFFRNMELKRMK